MKSERVKQMKRSFIEYRKAGYSIKKIAEIFKVTPRTVYIRLQEIADENGISREELLYQKKIKQRITTPKKQKNQKDTINQEILDKNFSEIITNIDNIIQTIDQELKKDNKEE